MHRSPADLDHDGLATLAREWLLAGHLIDRAGMPHVLGAAGRHSMVAVAIDEWMGASPIYTARMQQALGFVGDDVATMFKGMQLDVGAPPEFLNFRYRIHDVDHGEFHLDHCGALMDVEPLGDDLVHGMCHTIEDPTFEATVCASNPRARLSPVHRPPRRPADRHPHCHWTVTIDPDVEALTLPEVAHRVATTNAATAAIEPWDGLPDSDGCNDYSGDLDPDLRMEDFSSRALSVVAQEAALQGQLLVLSFLAAARDHDVDDVDRLGARQFTGVAGVVAERLVRAFGLVDDAAGLASLLGLHPAFHPRSYLDWRVDVDGNDVVASLWPCPATEENLARGWGRQLADGVVSPLAAIARALDPRWEVAPIDPTAFGATDGAVGAWRFTVGPTPHPIDDDVTLTAFSTGAAFEFRRTGRRTSTPSGEAVST